MSSLRLEFGGYFQMRMATDPDPTDELRGVSGYTFALAGEPDLDAKIHLQPFEKGVWQRKFGVEDLHDGPPDDIPLPPSHKSKAGGPRVGVVVKRASIDGRRAADYEGARVQFLDAQILENNGILIRNDYFFIDPLKVRVTLPGGELLAERVDWINPSDPSMPLWEASSQMLVRRQPEYAQSNSPKVAAATGLPDASNETLIKDRLQRRDNLVALRRRIEKTTKDDTEIAALTTRIEQLAIVEEWWNLSVGTWNNRPIDRRAHQLTLVFDGWNVGVNGSVTPGGLVDGDATAEWPLRFWMGGWDGDALTAWVEGSWEIALR